MKIEIVKEARKTMVLKVLDENNAILKAPKNMSQTNIQKFLISKQNWLEKVSKKIVAGKDIEKSFDFDNFIYLDGEKAFETSKICMDFDKLDEKSKSKVVKNYYLSLFPNLIDFAKAISEKIKIGYEDIKPVTSTRIWGSFNTKKQMKLNLKLLILPKELVEYVVIHELCHSKHMNHKPQFWEEVEKYCPDYKTRKKKLSNFSFVLRKDI